MAENGCHTVKDKADYGAFIPSALDDYGLDVYEFRVYCRITRRAGSGKCFESHVKIAKFCKMSERKVRDAIDLLIAARLIDRVDRPGKSSEYSRTHESNWMHPSKLDGLREFIQRKDKRQRITTPVGSDTPSGSTTPVGSDTTTPVGSDTPPLSDPTDEGTPLRYSHEGTSPLIPQGGRERVELVSEKKDYQVKNELGSDEAKKSRSTFGINDRFWDVSKAPWKNEDGSFREEMIAAFVEVNSTWSMCALPNGKRNDIAIENHLRRKERESFAETIGNESRAELLSYWRHAQSKNNENAEAEQISDDRASKWNELRARLAPFPEYEVYVHTDGDFQELRARHVVSGAIKIERFLPGLVEQLERSRQSETIQPIPF